MTDDIKQTETNEVFERQEQPPALKEAFKSIEIARRQISLYGIDHPNSQNALNELSRTITEFVETYERATCVFTKDSMIVNEHYFAPTTESIQIFQRIRARGAMAITFVGSPSPDQMREFLAFLNVEPREVRTQGGPSTYLRKHGVSRIVMTESVYAAGDDIDCETYQEGLDSNSTYEDLAVASAINWLTKQEEEGDEELSKLPITQILSQPESAAKLIREAVTKLHASRRDSTSGEIASEVVNDLKSLAGTTGDEWDKATPQIRKAISKLPQDMRPSFSGFTFEDDEEQDDKQRRPTADVGEVEIMIGEMLHGKSSTDADPAVDVDGPGVSSRTITDGLPKPDSFEKLFGARAYGPLSSWRKELQPTSVMMSTGTTLTTLLRWENSACEHGRIAHALAELVLRAMEINDQNCAILFTGSLIEDAYCEAELNWRRSNAISALHSLETDALITLINLALAIGSHEAIRIAASLIDLCPDIALLMVDLLGTHLPEEFRQSLTSVIVKAGTSASMQLSNLLSDSTPTGKLAALSTMVEIGRAWALEEVAKVIHGEDVALAVEAIKLLPSVRVPMVSKILVGAVSHPDLNVRHSALDALGEFGDLSTLDFLDRIAKRRPLFGRSRHESIRQAAERAAVRIRHEHKKAA